MGIKSFETHVIAGMFNSPLIPRDCIMAPHWVGPPDRGDGARRTSALRSSEKFALPGLTGYAIRASNCYDRPKVRPCCFEGARDPPALLRGESKVTGARWSAWEG